MTKIQKFFERIGLDKHTTIEHSFDFLKKLQYGAVTSIAYENLDILEGKPLHLDKEALFEKIVESHRGGYCFELNGLLSFMLEEMGFQVKNYFARYVRGETEIPMRRHRVLAVSCGDGVYFCDIGVGDVAPKYPVKMEVGLEQPQFEECYRFTKDPVHGWVLSDFHKGEWRQFVTFTEEKQYDVDFIQPSFYCEKHPDSVFNKAPMIAIKTEKGRKAINGAEYKEFCGTELVHLEENISEERYHQLLGQEFHLYYEKSC
ncbi:MAG: arylamine N-acetyltransferase [Ruminococcaceae bacterium]|nr:arylamine N-acetyltransferase [Oscillospiraceae bacterium]